MSGQLGVIKNGFNQIGVIVPDLGEWIEKHKKQFGIDRWRVYTYDSNVVKEMHYHGRISPYAMKIALSDDVDRLQVELIQALEGPSIYHDFVATKGYGFHHFGVHCEDVESTKREFEAAGFSTLQEGKNFSPSGDGHYAYIDTEAVLGYIIELRQPMSDRWPPEKIFE